MSAVTPLCHGTKLLWVSCKKASFGLGKGSQCWAANPFSFRADRIVIRVRHGSSVLGKCVYARARLAGSCSGRGGFSGVRIWIEASAALDAQRLSATTGSLDSDLQLGKGSRKRNTKRQPFF
jgi:hypothetical protein